MRFIFNPSTGNLESTDNVTGPDITLGDKFKLTENKPNVGQEDWMHELDWEGHPSKKPVFPFRSIPKDWKERAKNTVLTAELDNFNTPDLEQSPDSFLKPGETLEDWDVSFRRPNAYGGLQRQPFAPENIERMAKPPAPGNFKQFNAELQKAIKLEFPKANFNLGAYGFKSTDRKKYGSVQRFVERYFKAKNLKQPSLTSDAYKGATNYNEKNVFKLNDRKFYKVNNRLHPDYGKYHYEFTFGPKGKEFQTVKATIPEIKKFEKQRIQWHTGGQQEHLKKVHKLHSDRAIKSKNAIGKWVNNWISKNQGLYPVREFDRFLNDFKDAWKAELKTNGSKYSNPDYPNKILSYPDGFPAVGAGSRGTNLKSITVNGIPFTQFKGVESGRSNVPALKKMFFKYKLQNPLFKGQVLEYINWSLKPKWQGGGGSDVKSVQLSKAPKNINRDVVYFMGEILHDRTLNAGGRLQKTPSLQKIFQAALGPQAKKYIIKHKGSWYRWLNNFMEVAEIAGVDGKKLLAKQIADSKKMKDLFKVKNLPPELIFVQDHLLGLAEAKALGDKKIARQTLTNLVAAGHDMNRTWGQQGLSGARTALMKKFKNATSLSAKSIIIDDLNAVVKKWIPGKVKYEMTANGKLKMTSLQPQKTFKAKALAYNEMVKEYPGEVKKITQYLSKNKTKARDIKIRMNSGIPIDDILMTISSDLKVPLKAVGNVVGKVLKVAGPASFGLDVIPFAQVEEMGLDPFSKAGFKTLGEAYANLPRTIEDLFHVASDEGTWKTFGDKKDEDRVWKGHAKFGQKQVLNDLRNTPLEVLLEKIDKLERGKGNLDVWDKVMVGINPASMVGMKERAGKSPEKIKRLKEDLIKQWNYAKSLPADHPDLVGEEKVDIKETENVFGTQIPMKSITEGFSRDQFMAEGGRVGFEDGSEPEKKMSDEEILESIRKGVFELEQNWNTEKSIPGKVLDVADVSNWPYYAARMLRAGMNVAEISAKLPFVSIELLGKLATQPAFKVVDADTTKSAAELGLGVGVMEGMDDSWLTDQPQKKLEGTGLFTEAFKKLMPDKFAEKTGLNSLIESQEQAMQDKGMSQWPEIAGKNIEMGLDITLPFGYVAAANKFKSIKKLLTPLVKDKNVNKVIEEALTEQGMSRREFNTLIASGGMVAAIKALGLDSLFKGVRGTKELKTTSIQMLKNSSTKMPVWFPKFIDEINKKMTYEGSGMYTFKGTDDFLPGYHIERINDDYYITGKNDYGQEFQVTYEAPGWVDTGAPSGKGVWNEGEFRVDDAEPVHMDPDGNVDFDGVVRDDIDEVLGGTTAMENIATKTTRKNLTKGEEKVADAEGRAQSNYDTAKDEGYFDDVE